MEPDPIVFVLHIYYCKGKDDNLVIAIECHGQQDDVFEVRQFGVSSIHDNHFDECLFPQVLHTRRGNATASKLLFLFICFDFVGI